MLQPWWYNRELKERHFLATHVNSKYGLLSFYTLWCYQISIAKFLFSYSVYRRFTREFEPNQCSVTQKVYFWLKSVAQKCLQCLSSLIYAWNRTLACIFWCHCRPLHSYYCPAVVIQYNIILCAPGSCPSSWVVVSSSPLLTCCAGTIRVPELVLDE